MPTKIVTGEELKERFGIETVPYDPRFPNQNQTRFVLVRTFRWAKELQLFSKLTWIRIFTSLEAFYKILTIKL